MLNLKLIKMNGLMPNSLMGTVAADTIFIFPDVYLGGKLSTFVLLIMMMKMMIVIMMIIQIKVNTNLS